MGEWLMLDNYDLFEMHEAEQERKLARLPICDCCKEPIQQEKAVYYNDQWCCEECEWDFWQAIRKDFLENTDD